jgi:acyl-CoA dehydrogenase
MIDFSLTAEQQSLQQRTREFIRDVVIPAEKDPRQDAHGPSDELRLALVKEGKRAGLISAHMPKSLGGLDLDHRSKCVLFEEAGYSPFGPMALNIQAPDEGNMHLLHEVATPEQQKRWLVPLAAGDVRSCFGMTEPSPGAGSDPSMLQTQAFEAKGGYVIRGTKWFTTGALGATVFIIMARHADGPHSGGVSMFLADMQSPEIVVERALNTIDVSSPGGHCVVQINDLFVPTAQILGAPGEGFKYAQVRLSPARLTHCMRHTGAAQRAHDVAVAYATRRKAFGKTLIEHEGVGFQLVDNELDLHIARLAFWHCAWVLDQGELGKSQSSMAKVIVSEAVWRVVDRCVQVLGGQGTTDETIVAHIYRDIRAFRLYDGPSEVHRYSLANRIAHKAKAS